MTERECLASYFARRLISGVKNAREAQSVYREARAAGLSDDVVRKVRMGDARA